MIFDRAKVSVALLVLSVALMTVAIIVGFDLRSPDITEARHLELTIFQATDMLASAITGCFGFLIGCLGKEK